MRAVLLSTLRKWLNSIVVPDLPTCTTLIVYHFNNERAITITADVTKDVVTPLVATGAVLENIDLDRDWPGMCLVMSGEAEESAESMGSLAIAFIAAAVGIYLLLLLLFDSLTPPVMVMIAIPFFLIGVILAVALYQQAF